MSVDAIVVLGCRVAPEGKPTGPSLRRVTAAADAFARGVAPWVVASGGRTWHGVAEADAYKSALIAARVPEHCVLTELASMTTRGNAVGVARLFRARGWSSAALVTCDWHLNRALYCFERAGIECIPLPAPSPRVSLRRSLYRRFREGVSFLIDRGPHLGS